MAIYTFEPLYQHRIWGGQSLRTQFNREIPADQPIGEAWELVDREKEQSTISSTGQSLHALWTSADKKKVFGTAAPESPRFPILIKLLDANDKLSLQVHPPAAIASQFKGGEPKTEMWYFLHTTPTAEIYVGLKKGVSRADFEKAIENKTVADCFHRLKTKPGETMFLPSGRVHAIGSGNIILEIQQNSDTTFRVYDWDRVDSVSGKPRDLHIQESLKCIDFDDYEPVFTQPHGNHILTTEYFTVRRQEFFEKETRELEINPRSFVFAFVSKGTLKIDGREWKEGSSLFITADSGKLELEALSEQAEIVTTTFPEK